MFKPMLKLSTFIAALALLAAASQVFAADPVYMFKNYTPGIKGDYALVVGPTALTFDSVIAGQSSGPQSITFHNIGTSPISFYSVAAGVEFTQTNTCTFLPADATCSAAVSFSPTQTGTLPGNLTLAYDNGRVLNVPLSGTGVGALPIATFSTNSVDFGAVPLGSVATRGVQLDNTGQQPLVVSGVTTAGAAFGASHGCTTLEPTETCFTNVTFTPAVADPVNGTLEFITNAPGSPHDIVLSGSGATPVVGFAPAAPLTFGNTAVGATSPAQTVTVSNASSVATLSISSIAADAPFSVSATTCTAATLAPAANCTVQVWYAPVSVGSTQAGSLRVNGTLSGSGLTYQMTGGQAAYALTGTAVAAVPVILLSQAPATGGFGNVALGTPSSKVVTLTNTGYGALHLTSTSLSGTNAADFTKSDSTCESRTLAKDESCTITATATPTVPADESATLAFGNSDGAAGNTVTFSVTGQGAVITLKDAGANIISSVNFPVTSVGSNSTAIPVTLQNTGNATLTFSGGTIAAAAPFSQTNNCGTAGASAVSGSAIAAGASCTVFVTLSPTAAQVYNDSLPIVSNAYGYVPLTLTGSGNMVGVAQIAVGGAHTVVLKSNGTVWTTGNNGSGQLGNNTTTARSTFGPVQGISGTATAIAAGANHTVVIAGGTVQATGSNDYGQLGNSTTTARSTFGPVQGITGTPTAIAAGAYHTVVIAGGTVQTTGRNLYGELGNNTTTNRSTFGAVQGVAGTVTAIAAGALHTVVLAGGTVQATGHNGLGQLGNNTTTNRSTFGPVQGIAGAATAIAAGNYHTVVIAGGTVQTTGYNVSGQLGNNATGTDRSTFGPVQGITGTPTAIAAGGYNTVVIAGGTVQTTGDNVYGQLGNNTTANRSTFGQATPF